MKKLPLSLCLFQSGVEESVRKWACKDALSILNIYEDASEMGMMNVKEQVGGICRLGPDRDHSSVSFHKN